MLIETEIYIVVAVVVVIMLVTAAVTTKFGGVMAAFFEKTLFTPGRTYWAARMDAFGDASLFAAMGSISLDLLGIGQENLGMELAIYLFVGAIFVFITANWFRN